MIKNPQLIRKSIAKINRELAIIYEDGISLKKIKRRRELKRKGIAYSRYRLYNRKWLLDLDIRSILDIGANIGEFTSIFSELFPEAEIHAFEPLPDCYEKLEKRTENLKNIKTYNLGLGCRDGELKLHRSSWHPASSFRKMGDLHKQNYPHSSESNDILVGIRRLEDIMKEEELNNDIFIKMDVQGFEDEVIKGGLSIFNKTKVIVVESSFQKLYENEPMFDGIYALLKPLGFEFRGSLKQSISSKDGSFLQGDCIFIKP